MVRLDFSQFHPLDHWPWQRRCWSGRPQGSYELPFKGGPWHHLKLAWRDHRRDQLARLLWWKWIQKYRCPRGWHRTMDWYGGKGFIRVCSYCDHCCQIPDSDVDPEFRQMVERFTRDFPPETP